jgi:hypothetical protein
MTTYSQSKIKSWRRCHMQYRYKYDQKLVRRQAPAALARGVTFHEMLDATVLGQDWREPLEKYRKQYSQMWNDETEGYPSPEELESLYLRYMKKYENDDLDYGGRTEIEIQVEKDGIMFKGIVDKLPTASSGLTFVLDHKTHRILPDEDTRYSDIQTVLYYWALRELGEKVDGVCWDYIRTKPPAVPEVLKSGGLSRRANIDTDYETYLKAVNDNGLNPADYQDMLDKVKGNTFFKRIFLPRPNEDLVQAVVGDFFSTAKEIQSSTSSVRNLTRDCKMCSYYQLCSAEVRGLDSEFIKKQLFVVKSDS